LNLLFDVIYHLELTDLYGNQSLICFDVLFDAPTIPERKEKQEE